MPLAYGGPEVISTVAAYRVNEPISTWEKFNSNLFDHGRGQSGTPSIFD
jgi:hypothetical protein